MVENSYTIPRSEAAKLLRLSERSLFRHVQKYNISAVRRGREVFFNEADLKSLANKLSVKDRKGGRPSNTLSAEFEDIHEAQVIEQTETSREEQRRALPKEQAVETRVDILDIGFAKIRDSLLRRSPEEGIFKALYEKAELEMKELRGRLDSAHYRVGGLEAQIRSMVPMIAFKRQKKELLMLEEKSRVDRKKLDEIRKQLRIEQFVKKVYAGFLFFMLALVPLLIIMRLLNIS